MTKKEQMRCEAQARVLKALANPSRIFIIEKLQQGEKCVCDLAEMVGAESSTVSKHLSILKNVGLVEARREKSTVFYNLNASGLPDFLGNIEHLLKQYMKQQIFA